MSTRDKDLQEAADALNELFGQPALDQPYQVTDIRQIVASSRFEFALNLKTAQTLGLTVPPTMLALADEVIE